MLCESPSLAVKRIFMFAVSVTPADLGTEIPGRQGFGGEYLTHLAAVEVTRGLRGATGSAA